MQAASRGDRNPLSDRPFADIFGHPSRGSEQLLLEWGEVWRERHICESLPGTGVQPETAGVSRARGPGGGEEQPGPQSSGEGALLGGAARGSGMMRTGHGRQVRLGFEVDGGATHA